MRKSAVITENMKEMADRLAYLFMVNGGYAVRNGFIYNTSDGKPLEYKGRMICYPADIFDGNNDVIPFDVTKSSRLLEWMFAEFCKKMYYEGVTISRSSLLRVGTGSAVTFVMDDGNTNGQYTTPTSKNDAIAYTYAMCYINGVELIITGRTSHVVKLRTA